MNQPDFTEKNLRSPPLIFRIHIATFCNKQFGDFFVSSTSRIKQRIPSIVIQRVYICTLGD